MPPANLYLSAGETARLLHSSSGLVTAARRMGLMSAETSTIPWRAERVERELVDFGDRMLKTLRTGMDGVWPKAELTPPATSPGPVHRLWIPINASGGLPWEAACEPSGFAPFGDSRFSVTYRHVSTPDRQTSVHRECERPRVLVATAMPQGIPSANVELQRVALDHLFRTQGDACRWFSHHDLGVVRNTIVEGGYTALHVVAHGLPGRILWYDSRSNPVWFSAQEFVDALAGASTLTTVLWMVCHSGIAPTGEPSLLRASLQRLGWSSVAMRTVIDEVAAARFVHAYYATLLAPGVHAVETAVAAGRSAVADACRAGQAFPGQWACPMVAFRDHPVLLRAAENGSTARAPVRDEVREELPRAYLVGGDQRYPLSGNRVRIGRSRAADIVVTGVEVAPFHVTLVLQEGCWHIIDERSDRATAINGAPVVTGVLRLGDTLTVGGHEFVLGEETE